VVISATTLPIAAYQLFSVLFEKDRPDERDPYRYSEIGTPEPPDETSLNWHIPHC
jgi:hypothetical protein